MLQGEPNERGGGCGFVRVQSSDIRGSSFGKWDIRGRSRFLGGLRLGNLVATPRSSTVIPFAIHAAGMKFDFFLARICWWDGDCSSWPVVVNPTIILTSTPSRVLRSNSLPKSDHRPSWAAAKGNVLNAYFILWKFVTWNPNLVSSSWLLCSNWIFRIVVLPPGPCPRGAYYRSVVIDLVDLKSKKVSSILAAMSDAFYLNQRDDFWQVGSKVNSSVLVFIGRKHLDFRPLLYSNW